MKYQGNWAVCILSVLLLLVALPSCVTAQPPNFQGRERQVTSGRGPDQCPSWSPDGSMIAFHSMRSGNSDIWVVPAKGGELKRLTTSAVDEGHPAWSPDGRRIAFIRYLGDARRGKGNVCVVNADGKGVQQLTDDDTAKFGVQWCSAGANVIYGELAGTPADFTASLIELNVASKQRSTILEGYAGGVAVSPDGGSIAFNSFDSDLRKQCLYVMKKDDKRIQRIVEDVDRAWFPHWSPDGKRIAFHAGKGGNARIVLVAPDGTGRTYLALRGRGNRFPAWSPDGRKIAFTKGMHEAANIWVYELKDEGE